MTTSNFPTYPLTSTILPTTALTASSHLPALHDLILRAFEHGHGHGHKTVVLTERRLQGPAQIVEEIGPDGFCILAFATSDSSDAQETNLVATASAKPYTPPGKLEAAGGLLSKANKLFKRAAPTQPISPLEAAAEEDGEGLPAWEILLMAVEPELQGRGIASRLLGLTVEEIQKRAKGREVKILLSTLKELNEEYYKRKGWRTTNEQRFEAGVGGSEAGFGVVYMVKTVE